MCSRRKKVSRDTCAHICCERSLVHCCLMLLQHLLLLSVALRSCKGNMYYAADRPCVQSWSLLL